MSEDPDFCAKHFPCSQFVIRKVIDAQPNAANTLPMAYHQASCTSDTCVKSHQLHLMQAISADSLQEALSQQVQENNETRLRGWRSVKVGRSAMCTISDYEPSGSKLKNLVGECPMFHASVFVPKDEKVAIFDARNHHKGCVLPNCIAGHKIFLDGGAQKRAAEHWSMMVKALPANTPVSPPCRLFRDSACPLDADNEKSAHKILIREAEKNGDARCPNAHDKEWNETAWRIISHLEKRNDEAVSRNHQILEAMKDWNAPPNARGCVDPYKVTAEHLRKDIVRIRDNTATYNSVRAHANTCGASFKQMHSMHVNFCGDIKDGVLRWDRGEIFLTRKADKLPFAVKERKRAADWEAHDQAFQKRRATHPVLGVAPWQTKNSMILEETRASDGDRTDDLSFLVCFTITRIPSVDTRTASSHPICDPQQWQYQLERKKYAPPTREATDPSACRLMANAQNLCTIDRVCDTRDQWYYVCWLISKVSVARNNLAVAEVKEDIYGEPNAPYRPPMILHPMCRLWERDSNPNPSNCKHQAREAYWSFMCVGKCSLCQSHNELDRSGNVVLLSSVQVKDCSRVNIKHMISNVHQTKTRKRTRPSSADDIMVYNDQANMDVGISTYEEYDYDDDIFPSETRDSANRSPSVVVPSVVVPEAVLYDAQHKSGDAAAFWRECSALQNVNDCGVEDWECACCVFWNSKQCSFCGNCGEARQQCASSEFDELRHLEQEIIKIAEVQNTRKHTYLRWLQHRDLSNADDAPPSDPNDVPPSDPSDASNSRLRIFRRPTSKRIAKNKCVAPCTPRYNVSAFRDSHSTFRNYGSSFRDQHKGECTIQWPRAATVMEGDNNSIDKASGCVRHIANSIDFVYHAIKILYGILTIFVAHNAVGIVVVLRNARQIGTNQIVWHKTIVLRHKVFKVQNTRYSRRKWKRNIRTSCKYMLSIVHKNCRLQDWCFYVACVACLTIGGMQLPNIQSDALCSMWSFSVTCVCVLTRIPWLQAPNPFQWIGSTCMDYVEVMHRRNKCLCGAMNQYGSEGPIAHERHDIKKNKKHGLLFMSLNKTSIVTAMEYMKHCAADIVFVQELSQKKDKFHKTKAWLKKGSPSKPPKPSDHTNDGADPIHDKWKCEGTPSINGPNGGNSGGTAVATKIHIGITAPMLPGRFDKNNDNLYEVVPGHLSAVVVNGWVRSRCLAISVYMDVADKFKVKNRAILLAMGMLIVANALPFVAMCDWNNTPPELADTGWLDTVDAYAIAPHAPTCCTAMAKTGSVIDYAVVSNRLASMVDYIMADEDDPFQPHRRVVMKMHGNMTGVSECNAFVPTQYPSDRPTGPHHKFHVEEPNEGDDLEEHARKVMVTVENELAAKYHVDHVIDGQGFCTYANRSNGLDLKKVIGLASNESDGRQSTLSSLKLTQQRLATLLVMLKKAKIDYYAYGSEKQIDKFLDKAIINVNIIMATNLGDDQPLAEEFVEWYNRIRYEGAQSVESLRSYYVSYGIACDKLTAALANERANRYHDFMKSAISHKSGQAIHRVLKKMPVTMSRPVSINRPDTTEDQHHADEQIGQWSKVWGSEVDSAEHLNTLKWRCKKIDPLRIASRYQPVHISPDELQHFRDVIRTFSKSTATAHDRIPPRLIDDLGDDTLRSLIRLYKRCMSALTNRRRPSQVGGRTTRRAHGWTSGRTRRNC